MSKRKKPILKPLILSILLFLIILVVVIYVFDKDRDGKQSTTENSQQSVEPSPNTPAELGESKNQKLHDYISELFSLAKEGKVVGIPFDSGKAKKQEVHNKWGEPNQTTDTASGRYEEYKNRNVVIGYLGEIVSDIRSYDPELQKIRQNEIKLTCGEPDEIRYFKDETHDQIILVYQVNPLTELKWILPKPTDQEPNPKVDHISVYTQLKNQAEQSTPPDQQKTIADMSLDEKIGQMIFAGITGTTMDTNTKNLLTKYKVGGIILYKENLIDPIQAVQLLNQMKSENDQKVPLLLGVDQEGGRVTRLPGGLINFPTNKEIGATNNSQFSYHVGTMLGKELKEFGFNLDFAPVLDINSNPNNPVIGDRSYGNNSEIVSKLGIQTFKGIQSQNIIPTIKHFPGHGDTSVDSHLELPIVNKSLQQLKELELIPFEQAINSGADVVMVAHILLPKLDATFPSSMSKNIITGILRQQLDYSGVVITDDMTMKAIIDHYSIGRAAVESVKAGSDIILVGHGYSNTVEAISSLKIAVQKGEITEQRINESVSRILKLKKKYEINNSKVKNANIEELNQSIKKLLDEYSK
ncbi:beta-N-acetylhexosaminidase [Neobacillus drentensis]|uniref:beta-N-acetylhexosaminidase n=1 Tax=Neobacillus drentensis TaxID=220684 RepID=UPI00285B3F45|nr:beta-N-acetylhexosaminidase [Neobacillus drentensis]MDR7237598.1 beta-N-acetylhexosaminidase [Neobacillus drentensis]